MSAPVSVGDLVGRKYRIDRVLGEGGMGVVVAATDTQLERRVAIKFLLPGALANPEIVARFSREARAAAKIRSEHVARVIEVGELDTGTPYMVMEYLEGCDLAERIRSEPPVTASDAARFLLQACEALAEAHAAGIVHRDLKPANLFLAQQPDRTVSVKVLDFGISKAPVGTGGITSTQAVMGSPHYMSPEQLVSAKHVDHRSDVWALGIVLYETLAGSPPFAGDTMPEIVAKILQSPLPSLRAVRPDAPAEIEPVIARCTAKDPTARFGDVAELARALVAFAPDAARSADRATRILGRSAEPPSSKPATDAVPPSHSPEGAAQSEVRSHAAWGNTRAAGVPRRNVARYALASVLGVATIVGGFAVFGGRGPPPASAPVSASSGPADPLPPAVSLPASVVLSPPPTESAAASAAPSVEPSATKPAMAKPPHVLPKPVSSTAVASAAPQAPAPPPVPTDPLHMGIK
jgi:eukaryotic-like serine/threonine-protein kinase